MAFDLPGGPGPSSGVRPGLTRVEHRTQARRRNGPAAIPWVVAAATLVLRLATAATGPTDWDSAQYASAVSRFDVTHGQPQPPGYWLFVETGRLVAAVGRLGTIHALVLVAALASAAGAGLAAAAGRDLGGWWVGLATGLLVATSPFAWFSGSIVATYSFDMVACSLLIILAWRARPGSWHGIVAVAALGLLAGFRQSIVQSFAILALVAVAGSTRRWRQLGLTVVAGAAAVGIWFVPMVLLQPGGFSAWIRATRAEASGAAHATSVLAHAAGGATNLGTFAAYTAVALVALAALALLAGVALLVRHLVRPARATSDPADDVARDAVPGWERPWYQSRSAILAAAIVPPMLLVALVQFAKGGYLLAYLPAGVIVLLLPLGALVGGRPGATRASTSWMTIASIGVAAVVAVGAQRFVSGAGVLPQRWVRSAGALWLVQPRYQAPYDDTRATIRGVDAIDRGLHDLGPSVRPGRDVVLFDSVDGGDAIYRNAGWELPGDRAALIAPGQLLYNEVHGALYYASGTVVAVGPSGSVLLVASPALPGLASLVTQGYALPVDTSRPIGGYRVWQVLPGVAILGVRVVETAGPRPLGHGL